MAKTIQKKVKFSKGQVVPELAERVDLSILNESAQKMKNVVSTIYGGVRRRRGTKLIHKFQDLTYRNSVSSSSEYPFVKDRPLEEASPSKNGDASQSGDIVSIDYGVNEDGYCELEITGFYVYGASDLTVSVSVSEDGTGFVVAGTFKAFVASGSFKTSDIKNRLNLSKRYRYVKLSITGTGISNSGFSFDTIKYAINDEKTIGSSVRLFDFIYNDFDRNLLVVSPQKIQIFNKNEKIETVDTNIGVEHISTLKHSSKDDSVVFTHPKVPPKILKRTYEGIEEKITWKAYVLNRIFSGPIIQDFPTYYVYIEADASVGENAYFDSNKTSVAGVIEELSDNAIRLQTLIGTLLGDRYGSKDVFETVLTREGWSFSDLDIKDVPYAIFGQEEEHEYSSWLKPSGEEGAIKIKSVQDKDNPTEDGPDVFTADMVGQYIDGNGGRAKITEFVSTKEIGVNTVIPFYTSDPFNQWTYISGYEPVWGDERGYPRTCLFSNQRLWFGGSGEKPNTLWGSRLGDYFNFKNSGNYDNDSIDVTLLTNDVIVNMMENRGLHIFTTGQEITASESSLTPSGFTATTNTKNGSLADVSPVVLGDGTCCFIEKNGKSLLSYIYDYNQSSYTTGSLSMLSNLIEKPTRISLDRNSSRDKGDFLFVVLSDGKMIVNCFVLKENINSISTFETQGQIVDVCCLKNDIYLLVLRGGVLCLELIDEQSYLDCEDSIEITDSFMELDSFYANKTISVREGTKYLGSYTVNSLSQVNFGEKLEGKKVKIGFSYDSELISNNISINNKTTSVKKRITSAEVICKPELTKELVFNGKKKSKKDGIYTFYSCTPYGKEVNFNIRSEFEPFEVYSITLNINYEG